MNAVSAESVVTAQLTAVILAGGEARRMGGQDKGLIEVNGRAMVCYVAEALRPHVANLLISANRNQAQYAKLTQCPIVADHAGLNEFANRFEGPLAGMLAGLSVATTEYVLFAPCDSPLISAALVQRLWHSLQTESAELSVATDGQRLQPVFALLKRSLQPSLLQFLQRGDRKIDLWFAQHRMARADCADHAEFFLNINTPEEWRALEQQLHLV